MTPETIYIYIYIYIYTFFWHGKFWESSKYSEMSNVIKNTYKHWSQLFRVNFGWLKLLQGDKPLKNCHVNNGSSPGMVQASKYTFEWCPNKYIYIYLYLYIYIFFFFGGGGGVCLVNDPSSHRCSKTPLPLASQRLVAELSKGGGIVLDWVGPWRCWYKHQVDTSWFFYLQFLLTVSPRKQHCLP